MWYIFDTDFVWRGTMSQTISLEINHMFYECDTLDFVAPYSPDLYNRLKVGRILNRKGESKAYRLHSVEIDAGNQTIIGNAFGLEGMLNQRVVDVPITFHNTAGNIMQSLVSTAFISTSNDRKITGMSIDPASESTPAIIDVSYSYDSLYSIIAQLSKESGIGFKMFYDPINQTIKFKTYLGTDRTSNQTQNAPIIWRSNWGNIRGETIFTSNKEYKNVVYTVSGDETNAIHLPVGSASGWDRFEMIAVEGDISRTMIDGTTLTDDQVKSYLTQRGNLELFRNHYMTNEFKFVLNNNISQVYGVHYEVGDVISVVSATYDIIKHSKIIQVKERVEENRSQFEITFEQ